MRQKELGQAEHRLLHDLAGTISNRLEATFSERVGTEGTSLGVELVERGKTVLMEIPTALLARAHEEPTARQELCIRLKSTRDRMLYRRPPRPLPKNIASAADPAFFGRSGGFGRQSGRGRR